MTNPTPQPRRLMRSRHDRYLGGVCGGLAQYLNVDATLVRLLAVILAVTLGGAPILVYLVMLFLLPEGDRSDPPPPPGPYPPLRPPSAAQRPTPRAPHAQPVDPIWGTEGAPWEQPQNDPQTVRRPHPDAAPDRG